MEKIVFYVDSFNVFKNTNSKVVLLFNRDVGVLSKIENSAEVENFVQSTTQTQRLIRSPYNDLINNRLLDLMLIDNKSELSICESNKVQCELQCLEEKLLEYQSLNLKNEFIFYFDKLLRTMIAPRLTFKVVDYFLFYFQLNGKMIFEFLVKKF